ncbi:hypothetical protein [Mycobacterium asiaticum]|uniref:hypothetical protein n=1 Tax=Mycobacterium asiaticum TaxID=1790 RepID=UPI0007EF88B7|nr:hypothetical protein [Mycobacterium asiaticum]OBI98398.1 hypothetical protein A5661_15770 [Mycobacterium asiaticum]
MQLCHCGKELAGPNPRQRHCSAACKQRAYRAALLAHAQRLAAERERLNVVTVSFDADQKALVAAEMVADMCGMTLDETLRKALYAGLQLERDALRGRREPSAVERTTPIPERIPR